MKKHLISPLTAALILLLSPTAWAVVATCGFQQCDPYSGTCFTAWQATLAGQVQAQCAADPSSCWLTSLSTCTAPLAAPANPDAIRHCPLAGACADSPREYGAGSGYLIPGSLMPTGTQVKQCRNTGTGAEIDTLTCMAILAQPLVGQVCPSCPCHFGGSQCDPPFNAFTLSTLPGVVYEPPGNGCGWEIRPVATAPACVLPMSQTVMALKFTADMRPGMIDHVSDLRERIRVERWALRHNLIQGTAARLTSFNWILHLATMIGEITKVLRDPPNGAYQVLPAACVYPAQPSIVADASVTPTQAAALNVWGKKRQKVLNVACQFNRTLDNLGGAVNDAESGNLAAVPWVRRLARWSDSVMAAVVSKGNQEITYRAPVVAAYPASTTRQAACTTPTDAVDLLSEAVVGGTDLYGGHLVYDEHVGCGAAFDWPGVLDTSASADSAMWASLSPLGMADRVCTQTGWCSSVTTTTVSPLIQLPGKIRQSIIVTAVGQYQALAGKVVQISIPGGPAVADKALDANGATKLNVFAAPGSYAITVTFPEQQNAKYGASSATVTVQVQ